MRLFIGLVPLALISAFSYEGAPDYYVWMAVPVSAVLSWVYLIWDAVLDLSENPFEGLINDIPMTALSRTIEIDMREMLGETELPPPVQAFDGGVLL